MMGIYVNGIEMPKEPDEMIELAIFGDGKTLKTGESWRSPVDGKCYYGTSEDMNTYFAFAVPPHGRLVDADEMYEEFVTEGQRSTRYKLGESWELNGKEIRRAIYRLPTIIPASGGGET